MSAKAAPKHDAATRQKSLNLRAAGKSQRDVAKALGIHPSAVARWDRAAKDARPTRPAPAAPAAPPPPAQLEAAPAVWRFEGDTPPVAPQLDVPPVPDVGADQDVPHDQADVDHIPPEVRKEFGSDVSQEQAKQLVRSVAQQIDKRFVAAGCDPLAENELGTLETTCAPVVLKWLSGPLTPEVLALTGLVIVFGPRVAEVVQRHNANKRVAPATSAPAGSAAPPESSGASAPQAPPAAKVDMADLMARLGGPA